MRSLSSPANLKNKQTSKQTKNPNKTKQTSFPVFLVRHAIQYYILMAYNWQKWKSTFLTCHCHEIYREEAFGLKSSSYAEKIWFLWICQIWGNFIKNQYFVNINLIKVESKSSFAHMWHKLLWLSDACHSSFLLNQFSVKYWFSFLILRVFLPQNHLALLKNLSLFFFFAKL